MSAISPKTRFPSCLPRNARGDARLRYIYGERERNKRASEAMDTVKATRRGSFNLLWNSLFSPRDGVFVKGGYGGLASYLMACGEVLA